MHFDADGWGMDRGQVWEWDDQRFWATLVVEERGDKVKGSCGLDC